MSNVLVVLLVLLLLAGVGFVISRRRVPTIERGIKEFSREMQALAPRHPSEGPPKRRPAPPPDSKEPKKTQSPAVDPPVDDQPEAEA
ncbi:MAG: hypothetical protein ACC652_02865 [Acidimicrobiales bacterium]